MECTSFEQYVSYLDEKVRQKLKKDHIYSIGINVSREEEKLFSLIMDDRYETISLSKSRLPVGASLWTYAEEAAKRIATIDPRFIIDTESNISDYYIRFTEDARKTAILAHYLTVDGSVLDDMCRNYFFKNGNRPQWIGFPENEDFSPRPRHHSCMLYDNGTGNVKAMQRAPFPVFAKKPKSNSFEEQAVLYYIASAAPYKYELSGSFYGVRLKLKQ